jgi:uncharacterized protein YjbJ (UPF0337 family)
MNDNLMLGKWKEIKGDIKNAWGKLTDDEIEKAKGNVMSLAGTIQQKFGLAQEEVAAKLNRIVEKYKDKIKTDLEDKQSTSDDTYSS